MTVLSSKDQAGSVVGDVFGDQYIHSIKPSGAKVWANRVADESVVHEDSLTGTDSTAALASTQGPILNAADIASGALVGTNLVLTLKGGDTLDIDATAMLADLRVSSGVYNATTKAIDFTLTDSTVISVPVTALLPVVSDATLTGDGSTTALGLADNAVSTAKVLDDAITTAKLADNSVTLNKLAGGTAGKVSGFDDSGDPAELSVMRHVDLVTSFDWDAAPLGLNYTQNLPSTVTKTNTPIDEVGFSFGTTINHSISYLGMDANNGQRTIGGNELADTDGSYVWSQAYIAGIWQTPQRLDYQGAKRRYFAPATEVTVAMSGKPEAIEIENWSYDHVDSSIFDTIVFYTGTDTSSDEVTYVFHIDSNRTATRLEKPSSSDQVPLKEVTCYKDVESGAEYSVTEYTEDNLVFIKKAVNKSDATDQPDISAGIPEFWVLCDYVDESVSNTVIDTAVGSSSDRYVFTPSVTGVYAIPHSVDSATGGGAFLRIGSTSGGSDIFEGSGDRMTSATGLSRELFLTLTSGVDYHVSPSVSGGQTAVNFVVDVRLYREPVAEASSVYQTQTETLTYGSTAVESVSFTHDSIQDASSTNPVNPNIYMADMNIVRQYLGNGEAHVKISGFFIQSAGTLQDAPVVVTLPAGTLNTPFLESVQAHRPELNVSAYVVLTVSPDTISINRDDNINNDSPTYFEIEGIGNWVGQTPDAVALPDTVALLGDISNVDMQTVPPNIGDMVRWNGSNWAPAVATPQFVQEDFTATTTADDGISGKLWRFLGSSNAILTIDSTPYSPGAMLVVGRGTNAGATFTVSSPSQFINGTSTVGSFTLAAGHSATMVRQTQGAWMITSMYTP